jgi:hypothetical protein
MQTKAVPLFFARLTGAMNVPAPNGQDAWEIELRLKGDARFRASVSNFAQEVDG